jgi:hypothetical protein
MAILTDKQYSMKNAGIILMFLIAGNSYAQSQPGTYGWFTKNKIPYYRSTSNRGFDSFSSTAQGAEQNGFLPGYYVDKNGNKFEGEIQFNFPFIMERLVAFKHDGKTTLFTPKDIKGYFVDGIYRESVTINASMIGSAKILESYFMIPEIEGKISLYYYTGETPTGLEADNDLTIFRNYWAAYSAYIKQDERGIRHSPKTSCIRKEGEPGILAESMVLSFANKMSGIVGECTDLAAKVKGKEKGYKSADLGKIIGEYNVCN